jgi:Group II intron, maturase-specific domain
MGEPPLEIVAYSSGPFFPFRLKQNSWAGYFRHGYPRHSFRELNKFVQDRLIRHLNRRSQRHYRVPEGETTYAHLRRLGLQPL